MPQGRSEGQVLARGRKRLQRSLRKLVQVKQDADRKFVRMIPAGSESGPPPPVDNSVPFTSRIVIATSIPFKERGPGFLSETGMLMDSEEPTTCALVPPTLIVMAVRAPVTPMAPRRPKPASVATIMKTLTILIRKGSCQAGFRDLSLI